MGKKVLILGHTGKMGIALVEAFSSGYEVTGKNSKDFNAQDSKKVVDLIEENSADIVINAVAKLGIDRCETEPEKAFRINALFPKLLAELSNEKEFLLVHFSTDAVFNDEKKNFYTEKDLPKPLNAYGLTKYNGDCFIQSIAEKYYIFRISILFGGAVKNSQFVEKMLERVRAGGGVLKISNDITLSPTYSRDVAAEARRIVEAQLPYGLYHLANEGKATLYELMKEITSGLGIDSRIEKASHKDFQSIGVKNTYTPIRSDKITSLRPWREAVREYCRNLKDKA